MNGPTLAFVPGAQVARARRGEGALSGLSFAVKDVFAVRGHRSSAGHPAFAQSHPPAERDAAVLEALLSAGADLLGVTLLDELSYSLIGHNPHYGTPVNPRAPGRVCGGSSCGSAAAVAACLCDFALGTDTSGSIRVPASFCGLFGLRPSHGAISSQGVVPLAPSFDTVGFLARDAQTFEVVARVLLGSAEARPVERVLVADDALELCDAGVPELLEHVLMRACAKLSLPITRIKLWNDGYPALRTAMRRLQGREVYQVHGAWLEREAPTFSAPVQKRLSMARALHESGEGQEEDADTQRRLKERLSQLLTPGTLLFLPPTVGIAPRIDESEEALDSLRGRLVDLSCIASLSGVPQLVIPARELAGAPLGLSFLSARGSDAWLCAMAASWGRVLEA